jgi:glycosyltransferase involved in cell wall biosynthesis
VPYFQEKNINLFVGSRKTMGGRLGVFKNLKKYVAGFAPDIIHTHLLGADFFGWYFKHKFGKKITWICTLHNVEFNTAWYRLLIWKFILRRADRVIAVSENVFAYAKKEFQVPAEKLLLIRNGVELDQWLKIPQKTITTTLQLATVGRLETQKGHEYLIKALSKLKDYNWHWHVYGAGVLENKLKKLVIKNNLSEKVTWHGVKNNLIEEYSNIDVMVQPSLWEGLSLVTMEAMSAGRVVIGTPAVSETLISDKINGLVVKTADSESLVEALKYCFTNIKLLSEIGKKARQTAIEKCDLTKNFQAIWQVYEKNV